MTFSLFNTTTKREETKSFTPPVVAEPQPTIKQTIIKPEEIKIITPEHGRVIKSPEIIDPNKYYFEDSLQWEVIEKPIFNKEGRQIENFKQLTRSDNGKTLNVVTDKYHVTKNEFFNQFVFYVSEISGWKVEKFGEVQDGRKVMAFLRQDNDKILHYDAEKYLLIGNSHDSSSAFFIGSTSILARCQNQFTQKNMQIKFFHTENQQNLLQNFDFNRYLENEKIQELEYVKMRNKNLMPWEERNFIKHTLQIDDLKGSKNAELLRESIEREKTDLDKNVFALLQGATHFTTHVKKQRKKVFGNVFGSAAATNARAYEFCKDLIKD